MIYKLLTFTILTHLLCVLGINGQTLVVSFDFFDDFIYDRDGIESYTDPTSDLKLTLQSGPFNWEWQNAEQAPRLYIESGGLHMLAFTHNYTMTFTFNREVQLLNYTNSWVGEIPTDNIIRFTYNNLDYDITDHAFEDGNNQHPMPAALQNLRIAANTPIQLKHVNPDGSGHVFWKKMEVAIVPEPSSYILIFGILAFGTTLLRFRGRQ